MTKKTILALGTVAALAAGCALTGGGEAAHSARALEMMKTSFKENGQAKLDRLEQDETQRLCSVHATDKEIPKEVAARIEKMNLEAIKYPAGEKYLGDWKAGERIAQSGIGKQFTDDPNVPAGANCYACHQLSNAELSFGTIGPSLHHFGKLRGNTPAMQKYAYGKVYNAQGFSACSNMPRFGHQQILTEKQIQDVVALLMDPESPINK